MAANRTVLNTLLNERGFCKKLRENNAKESKKKVSPYSKGLIAISENDLFVWDNSSSHLIYYNLKNLGTENREERVQVLQCTDSPKFEVDWLIWNCSRTHLALWGQLGITVLELPQKWGKFAEFQGGKDNVTCKCISVAEHYFTSRQGLKLLQVSWHPGSEADGHVVFLTSDNNLSIYSILDPSQPQQTIHLGDEDHSIGMSLTRPSISTALGEHAVSFDFGSGEEVSYKNKGSPVSQRDVKMVWPVYCVKGNGDVVVAYSDLSQRPVKLSVQGPLLMQPPAEDNYGNDACAILCLPSMPPVVVISTCDGRLYHCVLLPRDLEDTTLKSESSFRSSASDVSLYNPPNEKLLYVYETVQLELLLTTPKASELPTEEDVFTCPIRLIKDPTNPERYHCSHAAGVHTLVLPWISCYQKFCSEDEEEDSLNDKQECIVEHLLCTKPVATSPPFPVLGLGIVKDELLGSTMLTLTSDFEFQKLRLSDTRPVTEATPLLSSDSSESIPSPLRRLSREPFDDRIRRILRRNTSNPLLKSKSNSELSQQECFELLSRATQVFREEYIQKQDIVWQEISRRVGILKEQKDQQKSDLNNLEDLRSTLGENTERLAVECEECKEKQEEILKRIEGLMRKMQSRIPFLSDPERNMKRELESMDEKLETYQRNLEQLKVKKEYQCRQIQYGSKASQPSPVIQSNQMKQLTDVLRQEGDELDSLMKKITQLKMDTTS